MKRLIFSVIPILILCVIFSMAVSPELNRAVLDVMSSTGGLKTFCDMIFDNLIKSWWSKEPFVNFRAIVVGVLGFAILLVYYLIIKVFDTVISSTITRAKEKAAIKKTDRYAYGGMILSYSDRYAEIFNNKPTPKVVSSFQVSALDSYYEGLNSLKYRDLVTNPGIVSLNRVETIKKRNETAEENNPQIMRLIRIFESEEEKENNSEVPIITDDNLPPIVSSGGEVVVDTLSGNAWKSLVPIISYERVEVEYNALLPLMDNSIDLDHQILLEHQIVIDGAALFEENEAFQKDFIPPVPLNTIQLTPEAVASEQVVSKKEALRTKLNVPEDYREETHIENGEEVTYYRNILTGEYVQPVIYRDDVIWLIVQDGEVIKNFDKEAIAAAAPAEAPIVEATPVVEAAKVSRRRGVGGAEEFFTDINTAQVKEERELEFPFVQGVRPRKKLTLEDIFSDDNIGRKRVRKTQFTYSAKDK